MPDAPPWLPLALLAALGAAGVARCFGKLGVSRADPTLATLARSIVMTVALLAFVGLRAARPRLAAFVLRGHPRLRVGVPRVAGLCGAGSWLAYFTAVLARGPVGPVAAVDRLSVAFTFVLAAAFLGERFGPRAWAGLASWCSASCSS